MLKQLHLQINNAANMIETKVRTEIPKYTIHFYLKPVNGLRRLVESDLKNFVNVTQNAAGRYTQLKKDLKTFTTFYIKLIMKEPDAFFGEYIIQCLLSIDVDEQYKGKLEAASKILQSEKEKNVKSWISEFVEYGPLYKNQVVRVDGKEYAVVWATSEDGMWIAIDFQNDREVIHRGRIAV